VSNGSGTFWLDYWCGIISICNVIFHLFPLFWVFRWNRDLSGSILLCRDSVGIMLVGTLHFGYETRVSIIPDLNSLCPILASVQGYDTCFTTRESGPDGGNQGK
jgi:hypothetical protein